MTIHTFISLTTIELVLMIPRVRRELLSTDRKGWI